MEYDYNTSKAQAAGCFGNANIAGSQPLRTLGGIATAEADLRELNARVVDALRRLGHCFPPTPDCAEKPSGRIGPDYGQSLRDLTYVITELRGNIADLETHI